MAAPERFRRLVLAIAHGEAAPATLRAAGEAARLLRLGLHCVLIEDEALFGLPALPFARELRLPTHEWRPVDPARLAQEFAAMEAALRRDLARLAASLGIAQALEVQRGDVAACFGGLCIAGDVVVLSAAAPQRPRPHPAALLHRAALRSAASVLMLPAAPAALSAGAAVAVLLAGGDDPALAVAARLAGEAQAGLVAVLAGGDPDAVAQRAAALGVAAARLSVRRAAGREAAALAAALGATRERLLVLDAAAWGGADSPLAEELLRARAAPVLVL